MELITVEIDSGIAELVEENGGYCPCIISRDKDSKCPCTEFREMNSPGKCNCGRFEKTYLGTNNEV